MELKYLVILIVAASAIVGGIKGYNDRQSDDPLINIGIGAFMGFLISMCVFGVLRFIAEV